MIEMTPALRTLRNKARIELDVAKATLDEADGDLGKAVDLLTERGLCTRKIVRYRRLEKTAAVFVELGWAGATHDDALALPLGTDAQQKVALAGLRSGEWERWAQNYGRESSLVDINMQMLWLFAVRVGVGAVRALEMRRGISDRYAFPVLVERGPDFARTLVERMYRGRSDGFFFSDSGLGVQMVARHRLPVPENRGYLRDWLAHAQGVLTGDASALWRREPCDETVIADRFGEHIRACLAESGAAGGGQFLGLVLPTVESLCRVLSAGVARHWLDRAEAVGLVLAALDAASRPADRKAWLGVWLDDLQAPDAEIVAQAEMLVPVLAAGDGPVVERLVPVLVAGVDDGLLVDVATVALTAPTKKALRVVLKALAARPRPPDDVLEVLGAQVAGVGQDQTLSRAVKAVVDAWEFAPDAVEPTTQVEGLWRPTPPVWEVPRFDHGDQTPEALTQAAAELSTRRESNVVDVVVERFLALANAVACRDPELARTALSGVHTREGFTGASAGLEEAGRWVRGLSSSLAGPLLPARECAVFSRLGQVPCLLSEPSTADLRIAPTDLLARLREYDDAGASAAEPDLLLALTRLDFSAADQGLRDELSRIRVPVLLRSGEQMTAKHSWGTPPRDSTTVTAGQAVAAYLADPVVEPAPLTDWKKPCSLDPFPDRFGKAAKTAVDIAVFPTWEATAAVSSERWQPSGDIGLRMRQAARRATPLPPSAVVDFLTTRRTPADAADAAVARGEAWERGLLRPGEPGVRFVSWAAPPDGLAAMAHALDEAAREGLLAVVWQILDDLAGLAASGPRLAAGTSELVQVVAGLLPEVQHAVTTGIADPAVLNLPGTRALAARQGSSQAVTTARQIVAGLPAPTVQAVLAPVRSGPSFEAVWPDDAGTLPAVVDGATFAAWVSPDTPNRPLRFDLMLADEPEVRFEVFPEKVERLDLGRCFARRCPVTESSFVWPGAVDRSEAAWLHWDTSQVRLVGTVLPLSGRTPLPSSGLLSTSLVTVALGLLAYDGSTYGTTHADAARRVVDLVDKNMLGSAGVRIAVATLLEFPEVNPAKMVRVLEKSPTTLPVLWPLLTEPVRVAGTSDSPVPKWLNRVLDVALFYADHLREAARRGLLPADAAGWPGLAELAARPGRSAALTKARSLLAALGDNR